MDNRRDWSGRGPRARGVPPQQTGQHRTWPAKGKRAMLYRNGQPIDGRGGRTVLIPATMEQLLDASTKALGLNFSARMVFTAWGDVVQQVEEIADGADLVISKGEPFRTAVRSAATVRREEGEAPRPIPKPTPPPGRPSNSVDGAVAAANADAVAGSTVFFSTTSAHTQPGTAGLVHSPPPTPREIPPSAAPPPAPSQSWTVLQAEREAMISRQQAELESLHARQRMMLEEAQPLPPPPPPADPPEVQPTIVQEEHPVMVAAATSPQPRPTFHAISTSPVPPPQTRTNTTSPIPAPQLRTQSTSPPPPPPTFARASSPIPPNTCTRSSSPIPPQTADQSVTAGLGGGDGPNGIGPLLDDETSDALASLVEQAVVQSLNLDSPGVHWKLREAAAKACQASWSRVPPAARHVLQNVLHFESNSQSEWVDAVVSACSAQGIDAPVGSARFMDEVDAAATKQAARCTFSDSVRPHVLVAGPRRSGRTAMLHTLTHALAIEVASLGTESSTVFVPIDWGRLCHDPDACLAGPITRAIMDALSFQHPSLARLGPSLVVFVQACCSAKPLPNIPASFASEFSDTVPQLRLLGETLQRAWKQSDERPIAWANQLARLPLVLPALLRMAHIIPVYDRINKARCRRNQTPSTPKTPGGRKGRRSTAEPLPTALTSALSNHGRFVISGIEPSAFDEAKTALDVVSTIGIVSRDCLLTQHPACDVSVRMKGVEESDVVVSIDSFGGCPAFLSRFVDVVESGGESDLQLIDQVAKENMARRLIALYETLDLQKSYNVQVVGLIE